MPSKDIKTTSTNSPVRTIIKVKTADGSFQSILPMTDSVSVLGTSGQSIAAEISAIQTEISSSKNSIQVLDANTRELAIDMTSLVEYVNPLMDDLKSHMEVVDLGNDIESTIFDHVYDELDAMASKVSTIESSLTTIISKLDKVISDNSNLTKKVDNLIASNSTLTSTVNNLIASNSTLTNTVDDLVLRLEQHQDTII